MVHATIKGTNKIKLIRARWLDFYVKYHWINEQHNTVVILILTLCFLLCCVNVTLSLCTHHRRHKHTCRKTHIPETQECSYSKKRSVGPGNVLVFTYLYRNCASSAITRLIVIFKNSKLYKYVRDWNYWTKNYWIKRVSSTVKEEWQNVIQGSLMFFLMHSMCLCLRACVGVHIIYVSVLL